MITIKSPREVELLRIAGNVVYKTHQYLKPFVKEGITTEELNRLGEEYIISQGCTPSFKGYEGFPAGICMSVNSEVVHGFPSKRKLKNGDILTMDIGACWKDIMVIPDGHMQLETSLMMQNTSWNIQKKHCTLV